MKKIKKYLLILSIATLVLLLANATYTFAKYATNKAWDYYLKSKGFYLSSDYLNTDNKKNVNNNWDGKSVYFNIKNFQNEELITAYDIEYSVDCAISGVAVEMLSCHLNGTENDTITGTLSAYQTCINNTSDGVDVKDFTKAQCEIGNYVWEQQVAIKDLYFDIVPKEDYVIDDVNVTITLTSTDPYKKTLTGDFKLIKEKGLDDLIKEYKDHQIHGDLTLTNTLNEDQIITLSWDSNKLIIDQLSQTFSDSTQDSSGYINSIEINIKAKQSITIKFYKKDKQTYNSEEFTINKK